MNKLAVLFLVLCLSGCALKHSDGVLLEYGNVLMTNMNYTIKANSMMTESPGANSARLFLFTSTAQTGLNFLLAVFADANECIRLASSIVESRGMKPVTSNLKDWDVYLLENDSANSYLARKKHVMVEIYDAKNLSAAERVLVDIFIGDIPYSKETYSFEWLRSVGQEYFEDIPENLEHVEIEVAPIDEAGYLVVEVDENGDAIDSVNDPETEPEKTPEYSKTNYPFQVNGCYFINTGVSVMASTLSGDSLRNTMEEFREYLIETEAEVLIDKPNFVLARSYVWNDAWWPIYSYEITFVSYDAVVYTTYDYSSFIEAELSDDEIAGMISANDGEFRKFFQDWLKTTKLVTTLK